MNAAYKLARKHIGLSEKRTGHNAEIVQFFADVGHSWVDNDETAWCAAFMGSMLKRAGFSHTGKLNARSYEDWGEPVPREEAREGDVVVFWRGSRDSWKGHVAFLVKDNGATLTVLGGNQKDQVNERDYVASRLLEIRRLPEWNAPKPRGFIGFLIRLLKGEIK